MINQPGKGGDKACRGERFKRPFPEVNGRIDRRVLRQIVIQLRLVVVVQHVHDMRPAHPLRVVDTRVGIATRFQLIDPLLGNLQHLLLGAKVNGPGRTGLHAGWLLTNADAIHAQRAFVDPVVLFIETRHVERTARDAVSATDAVILLEIDDAIGVLNNRPR